MTSNNVIYTNIPELLLSCTSLKAQKDLIELILMNMLAAMNEASTTGQFEEYKLDTGQTKTEIRYRDINQLNKAYDSLFRTWEKLNNKLNINRTGRQFRLMDGRNFRGRNYNG